MHLKREFFFFLKAAHQPGVFDATTVQFRCFSFFPLIYRFFLFSFCFVWEDYFLFSCVRFISRDRIIFLSVGTANLV